jgi:hypothetical protein
MCIFSAFSAPRRRIIFTNYFFGISDFPLAELPIGYYYTEQTLNNGGAVASVQFSCGCGRLSAAARAKPPISCRLRDGLRP